MMMLSGRVWSGTSRMVPLRCSSSTCRTTSAMASLAMAEVVLHVDDEQRSGTIRDVPLQTRPDSIIIKGHGRLPAWGDGQPRDRTRPARLRLGDVLTVRRLPPGPRHPGR